MRSTDVRDWLDHRYNIIWPAVAGSKSAELYERPGKRRDSGNR